MEVVQVHFEAIRIVVQEATGRVCVDDVKFKRKPKAIDWEIDNCNTLRESRANAKIAPRCARCVEMRVLSGSSAVCEVLHLACAASFGGARIDNHALKSI